MEPVQTFVAYTGDAYAIERTLRFLQATFGVLASLSTDVAYVTHSNLARANIHLARRFYRAFKWMDCVYEVFAAPKFDYGGLHENVRMLKDSALAMYFFFDMLILPTAMTGVRGPGNATLENTALTCWFYAILLSITLNLIELSHISTKAASAEKDVKANEKSHGTKSPVAKKERLKSTSTSARELICNVLDLAIPGVAIGYVKLDPAYVHIAMATSSLITMNAIWNRIYAEKEAAPS
ncbi:uncharacterized protein AB675_7355 [Cyphellophora attinorum]|uniref:Uncharacterized protein n=1 Tax=Cyphellophora attinorum TaxID=1664694 RepID=A0A0N1GZ70_9EURO|nr:uncharacterized protein AB675_7355 [Phialophora attinorum]KPI36350.1 hypothetical protein AB675_7355 [Phialophora attinorum]